MSESHVGWHEKISAKVTTKLLTETKNEKYKKNI